MKPFQPNVHYHKIICLLILNLQMSITKVTGLFHLEIQETICCKISKWCHYQILEPPTLQKMIGLLSFFVHIQNLCLLTLFLQNEALIKLWKKLFVSAKLLFWFLHYSNFRRKLGNQKWNNYDIMNWIAHITNFNCWKNSNILLN